MFGTALYSLKWELENVAANISLAGTVAYNKMPMSVRKIRRPSLSFKKKDKSNEFVDSETKNEVYLIESKSTESSNIKDDVIVEDHEKENTVNATINIYCTPDEFKQCDSKEIANRIYTVLKNNVDRWLKFVTDEDEKLPKEEQKKRSEEFTNQICHLLKCEVIGLSPETEMDEEQIEDLIYSVVDENTVNAIIQSVITELGLKSKKESNTTKDPKKEKKEKEIKLNLEKNVVKDEKTTKLNFVHYEDPVEESDNQNVVENKAEENPPKTTRKRKSTTKKSTTTKTKNVSTNKAINGEQVDPFVNSPTVKL